MCAKIAARRGSGRSRGMLDERDGACPGKGTAAAGVGGVDSYTLIVRLNSGVELEYDLDPVWFPKHMSGPSA